ncbi:MAG TPA: Rid family hydrolase [Pseudolysinimonas sp.]|nr:Rid family hydrolase [Pseudolysinimonas sp.]
MLDHITPEDSPPPLGAYSPAVAAEGLVFTAGHVGTPGGDFADEVDEALRELAATLAAAGSDLDSVVRMECLLADLEDFPVFDAVYRRHFSAPFPARATFGVSLVAGHRVEVLATAVRRG